jgi:hypothetical protein
MPKSRKRKSGAASKGKKNAPIITNSSVKTTTNGRMNANNRPFMSPSVRGPQSLIWPVMVSLGCWGMAFSFLVFSKDVNHVLFAGMAALMALLWTFSVGVRIRKLLLLRQR